MNDAASYLEFSLGGRRFAVSCALVAEVLPMLPLRALPGAPPGLLGVFELRGELLPLVDPRVRLGWGPWTPVTTAHIVVVDAAGVRVGLVVDSAEDVFSTRVGEVCRPGEADRPAKYTLGVVRRESRDVLVADLDALVANDVWTHLRTTEEGLGG